MMQSRDPDVQIQATVPNLGSMLPSSMTLPAPSGPARRGHQVRHPNSHRNQRALSSHTDPPPHGSISKRSKSITDPDPHRALSSNTDPPPSVSKGSQFHYGPSSLSSTNNTDPSLCSNAAPVPYRDLRSPENTGPYSVT
jgi:hypothetical protein